MKGRDGGWKDEKRQEVKMDGRREAEMRDGRIDEEGKKKKKQMEDWSDDTDGGMDGQQCGKLSLSHTHTPFSH